MLVSWRVCKIVHGNLRVPPQCHPTQSYKALCLTIKDHHPRIGPLKALFPQRGGIRRVPLDLHEVIQNSGSPEDHWVNPHY